MYSNKKGEHMLKTIKRYIPQKITLLSTKKEAQNAPTVTFTKPTNSFKAGQHFLLKLPHDNQDSRGNVRILSTSSAPDDDTISFTTRFFGTDSSSYKKALFSLKKGAEMTIVGPMPLLDVFKISDYTKPQVFLVGGIGATPLYSILRDEYTHQRGTTMKIFYTNRDADFIFGKEIDAMVSKLKNVELVKIISPKKITESDLKKFKESDAIFTLSGTEGFTDYYVNLLRSSLDIPAKRIHSYKQKPILGGGY
jgi:ferredoxin-NADP reductase